MNLISFESCPEEIKHTIFSFLDIKTLVRAGTVSKGWVVLSNDGSLWKKIFRQMDPYAITVIGLDLSRLDVLKLGEMEKKIAQTKVFFSQLIGPNLERAAEAELVLNCFGVSSLKKVDEYVRQLDDGGSLRPNSQGGGVFGKSVRLEKIAYEYLKYNRLVDAKVCLTKVPDEDFYLRIAQAIFDKYIDNNDLDSATKSLNAIGAKCVPSEVKFFQLYANLSRTLREKLYMREVKA